MSRIIFTEDDGEKLNDNDKIMVEYIPTYTPDEIRQLMNFAQRRNEERVELHHYVTLITSVVSILAICGMILTDDFSFLGISTVCTIVSICIFLAW